MIINGFNKKITLFFVIYFCSYMILSFLSLYLLHFSTITFSNIMLFLALFLVFITNKNKETIKIIYIVGCICDFFAYPNGDYTEESNLFVKESDYKVGFFVEKKRIYYNGNLSCMPLICAPREFEGFKILISLYPKFRN